MIIGIDLGTTNSLVAYYTLQGVEVIPNRLGKTLTPSVVSVDEEGTIYIGETAKERMLIAPEETASVFKRDMGSEKKYFLGKKEFTPEQLSALIIRSLKEDAEAYLGEKVTEAIISVPAYFNDARRKATKQAGELAGLKVERIISEPTAAAIAYGLYQSEEDMRFLVFDLGGGTFDVSILERYGNILEVHAVAGDNFLGGEDFTQVLVEHFLKSNPELDPLVLENKVLKHIYKNAEEAKVHFTGSKCCISCYVNEKLYEAEMTLEEYEKACEPLFDKMRQPIKKSLTDSQLNISQIDKVVMVGGATKMPIIRKFVGRLFKNIPDTSLNPDEVVVIGVAMQGAMKEREESIKEVILTDVCPFTLGTEVVHEIETNRFENGHFCPIIERNTVIPASRVERLYTVRDNQTQIAVKILQGESRYAYNNLLLGEVCIDVPKNKAGAEAVDVTYTYDINAILEVQVKSVSTGKVVKELIKGQYTPLSDAEIEERMKELEYLKVHPRDQEENKLLLLRGERMYEEALGDKRIVIQRALEKFERALGSQDRSKLIEERKEFKEFLDSL